MQPIGSSRRQNHGGQRARQRDATHRKIFEAARKLFMEKGYFDTRSTDIAKAAGCSTGSVFAHFDSKAKIMTAVMGEVYDQRLERLRSASWQSRDARGRLREIIHLLWRSDREEKDLLRAFFSYSWFHDPEDEAVFQHYVEARGATVMNALAETEDWAEFSAECDVEFAFPLLQSYHENLLRQSVFEASDALEQRLMAALDYLF